jgi:hypothetical protein
VIEEFGRWNLEYTLRLKVILTRKKGDVEVDVQPVFVSPKSSTEMLR